MKKIGIIGAMEPEVELYRDMLSDAKTETVGAFGFYTGYLGENRVTVARAGVGKVNAAVCATLMAEHFGVELLINTGCSGALVPELDIGDIVVADSLIEYDIDYGALEPGNNGVIYLPLGGSVKYFETDRELSRLLADTACALGYSVKRGRVATGDRFVSDREAKHELFELYGAVSCEMEGAAIAHAARLADVPVAVIRSISDRSEGASEVDFMTFVTEASHRAAKVLGDAIASIR